MPVECPKGFWQPDACESCEWRIKRECHSDPLLPRNISEIMTTVERLYCLEKHQDENLAPYPPQTIDRVIKEIKGHLFHLQKRLNEHLDKTPKTKSEWD